MCRRCKTCSNAITLENTPSASMKSELLGTVVLGLRSHGQARLVKSTDSTSTINSLTILALRWGLYKDVRGIGHERVSVLS
jgi:hypothetical protein